MRKAIQENSIMHPCYNCNQKKLVRVHIPLVMQCNMKCNYCNRKIGCINENRPGVTRQILSEEEIENYFESAISKYKEKLRIVGFAGPGEVLTDIEKLKKVIKIVSKKEGIEMCLATNGLLLPFYAEELLKLGVNYFTVTMNAYTIETAKQIYSYIEYQGERIYGENAVRILLENQKEGIRKICKYGGICKINVVAINGINVDEIKDIMEFGARNGAYIGNIIPLLLVDGTSFSEHNLMSELEIDKLRCSMEKKLRQMKHCKRCRADAVGDLQ